MIMGNIVSPGQDMGGSARGLYIGFGKRILDILFAAAALLILSPVVLACATAIYVDSRGSIFYAQWRVGRNGVPFRIIKLRTMVRGADTQGPRLTASGDPRITRVGRILRRTKLDELPQLLNVLRGDMSLVGPRPELPEYVAKYTARERKILDVKPGITGPASLTYIDEETVLARSSNREQFYINHLMRDKLATDLAYCRTISLSNDVAIILRTAASLFHVFRGQKSPVPQDHFEAANKDATTGQFGLSLIEQVAQKGTHAEFEGKL